jgi:hypothetical protein
MKLKQQTIKEMIRYLQSLVPKPHRRKQPRRVVTRFGLDGESAPASKAFRAVGASFFCGYLSTRGNPKNLTSITARRLRKDRIDIVTVFETTATRASEGFEAGRLDAISAIAQLKQLGAPAHAPVFFAVDYEAKPAGIHDYFRGVNSALMRSRVGAYGDFAVIDYLFRQGLIQYGWQTYAWSGKLKQANAQLYQFSNGHSVGGVEVDFNRSYAAEFGQW